MPARAIDENIKRSGRWGVVLAGGDGMRLLSLTRTITGEDTPKQFCSLTGDDTLLEQTRRRISRVIPQGHELLVLTRTHERFYANQLHGMPDRNLLIQPYNQGTAPAIVYSLTHLNAIAPEAVVGFFPSDHYFTSDEAFAASVERAFLFAEQSEQHVLLLGVAPDRPEEEYGWIEPGVRLDAADGSSVFAVRRFWEKPSKEKASHLMRAGCLWNSFIMVGRLSAFIRMVRESLPGLLAAFVSVQTRLRPETQESGLREMYSKIPASNFSHDVLSVCPSELAVLPVRGLGWTDLGEPERVLSVLQLQPGRVRTESMHGYGAALKELHPCRTR
ncbi:MAG: sugar phosphate nucleotidyltransferase [Acidobacteriaceae bacterium]